MSSAKSASHKGKGAPRSQSHKGGKDKRSDKSPRTVGDTVDSDYLSTLQAQLDSEKSQQAASASTHAAASKKKANTPKVVDTDTGAGIDPAELKAAMKAAQADADSGDDEGEGDAEAAGAKGKASKGDAAGSNKSGSKSRLIKRADESMDEYKLRLKAEMRRRKHEKRKAARAEVIKAEMAAKHEEALQRKAARAAEHAAQVARERAAKLEKLERAKQLEGMTNKEKRKQKHLWAAADAARDAAATGDAAATTSAPTSASSSAASTPAASTKKGSSASASATAAATSTAATPASSSSSSAAAPRPKSKSSSLTTSTPTPVAKASTLPPDSSHLPLPAHSAWDPYNLHPAILRALLLDLKFTAPTPIQEAVLLPAIRDWKDVSAAATTGSGKTLAFGIPIVHRLLMLQDAPGWEDPKKMQALILTPTRELALQIVEHISAITRYASPRLGVTPIVGGMASDKQKRVCEKQHPAIIVATPGRLWELMEESELTHFSTAYFLRFLVLDEADRMVDQGHYAELEKILAFIERNSGADTLGRTHAQRAVEAFDGFEMLDEEEVGKVEREGEQQEDEDEEQEGEEDEEGSAGEEDEEEEEDEDAIIQRLAAQASQSVADPAGGKGKGAQKASKSSQQKKDDIDWNSFLSEEEIFRRQGRRMPKESATVVAVGSDEEAADHVEAEDAEEGEDAENEEMEDGEDEDAKDEEGDASMDDAEDAEHSADDSAAPSATPSRRPLRRQIFLFSATLMLPSSGREDANKVKHGAKNRRKEPATVLEKLSDKITFQPNTPPLIVDLTRTHQVAATLEEVKAECLTEDKDYMVYYFLLLYPGRTLVFVNSISCLRRLVNLLLVLKMPALPLHAEMQQKARLKSLERFKERENSILICTDVAARGLDIPKVPYIVHYQLPRTPEIYIHRSGRVARAGAAGLSFALVCESEQKIYRRLCLTLKKIDGIPSLSIDAGYMSQIRSRMNLARQIDEVANANRKGKAERDWFVRQAEAMEMELDEDELQIAPARDTGDDDGEDSKARAKDASVKLGNMQRELDFLLSKPLMHGTLSRKFYTLNAARGFDLGAESAKIARAGANALATNGVIQPQNQAVGTQARALKGLPDMLKKARTQEAPAAAQKESSGVAAASGKKTKSAAPAAAAATPAAKVVVSLSAKRKAPEPAEPEPESSAAPKPTPAAAATPKAKKAKAAK